MWSLVLVAYNIKHKEIRAVFIGLFENPELALETFEKEKEKYIYDLKEEYDLISNSDIEEFYNLDYIINEVEIIIKKKV